MIFLKSYAHKVNNQVFWSTSVTQQKQVYIVDLTVTAFTKHFKNRIFEKKEKKVMLTGR